MRFPSPYALLCATIGAGLLAGCSGTSSTSGSSAVPNNPSSQSSRHASFNKLRAPIPLEKPPIQVGSWARPSWYREAPDTAAVTRGIYVSQFMGSAINGYKPKANKQNLPPICSEYATSVNDVATDSTGDMIQPDGGSATVDVYQGPNLCGPLAGSFPDNDGQPSGATTKNALTDTIYVANILLSSQTYGGVSVCTLAGGCTGLLTNPAINDYAYSVALDKAGNLYFAGRVLIATSQYSAALVLYKNGQGAGEVVPGYANAYPGGLDFDRDGNLLAIDAHANGVGALYIYTGCPDACKANGPWPLQAESVFGKLDRQNDRYYVGDFINGTVDVYKYKGPKGGISYLYSFNNGLTVSGNVHGIALNRPSTP